VEPKVGAIASPPPMESGGGGGGGGGGSGKHLMTQTQGSLWVLVPFGRMKKRILWGNFLEHWGCVTLHASIWHVEE
jgi:hypothetical protein